MFLQLEPPLRLVTSHMVLNSPLLNQARASCLNIMDRCHSFKDSFPIEASFLNSIQDNFLNITGNYPSISSFRGNFKDNNFPISNTQDSFSSFKGNFHNTDSSLSKDNTILALVNNNNSNRRMDPEHNSRHHQDSCLNSLANNSLDRIVNSNN